MTPKVFEHLPFQQQIRLLYQEGTFVTSIRYYGYKVNLYLLHGYYFEVFYNHKNDCIEKIAEMDKGHTRMKFYMDQIRLPLDLLDND